MLYLRNTFCNLITRLNQSVFLLKDLSPVHGSNSVIFFYSLHFPVVKVSVINNTHLNRIFFYRSSQNIC